jgi:hypothetical protein
MIIYELVRELYGMPWSRFAWEKERPIGVGQYFDIKHEKMGRHYSMVAVLLLHMFPPDATPASDEELEVDKDMALSLTVSLGSELVDVGTVLGNMTNWQDFVDNISSYADRIRAWAVAGAEVEHERKEEEKEGESEAQEGGCQEAGQGKGQGQERGVYPFFG